MLLLASKSRGIYIGLHNIASSIYAPTFRVILRYRDTSSGTAVPQYDPKSRGIYIGLHNIASSIYMPLLFGSYCDTVILLAVLRYRSMTRKVGAYI